MNIETLKKERERDHKRLWSDEEVFGYNLTEVHLLTDLKYDFKEIILELRPLVKEMRGK